MVERHATVRATRNEKARLRRFAWSLNMPNFSGPLPKNQSRVNPSHGRDGYMESLKARIMVTTRGANKRTKYAPMNRLKLHLYLRDDGRDRII
jgi:hypothetical protein